ncbi:DNA gyrase inhibitor YacG [uncultured Legionella sp.]|uniref:DNA gyrase inhibitor YacG n=1 Tax=uncultured Legionella sp. TaxID=210934 RepID=UPI00260DA54D|nr:DNA gyrase inhibitor YacG [uncultured Legionella sp.]
MNNLQNITCPTCGKTKTWQPENKYRPFCSDRCKLIDLGEWANESRVIPGDSVDPDSLLSDKNDSDDPHF